MKKVLVVDDRLENIIALEILLKKSDLSIIRATSGNEALALTLEHEFALALIDVQMPDMDGFETVKLMRKVERTRHLPIIFLSAIYSEDHYKIQGIEAGAVDFITKPFQPRILLGKVKIFLELYENKKKLEKEIEHRIRTEAFLRETETRLLEAKKKAEESDMLKTAFLANMSHEIRTPLTLLLGFAGLLADSPCDEATKKKYSTIIHKSSDSLTNIINDILDVAKIESGQFNVNTKKTDINILLNELYVSFQAILKGNEKTQVTLKLMVPAEPVKDFITDENRIKQVLTNLLNNAIKFTEAGSIEFGYRTLKNGLRFFVKDTGVGLPAEKYDLIFERFQKLDNPNIYNSSGAGLGLSIAKKIIELLNGTIHVTSQVNSGSEFTFYLPYLSSNELKSPNLRLEPLNRGKINWTSKNILIVEDDSPTYQLLESMLANTGVKLNWAKNGKEAVEIYLKDQCYNLVLMDINMPAVTWVEAFIELRKINVKLPIIAHTAHAMVDEKQHLESIGFDGLITKPIVMEELLSLLNPFLS